MGLQHMWQGMVDVAGSRNAAMMGLKKAFGNYDYAEDEEYIKDLTLLQQNPSKNNLGAFYKKWEDDLDGKTMGDIAKGIQYIEGTNPYYETELNKDELEKSDIDMKYYGDFAEIEFGLAENKLAISDTQKEISDEFAYDMAELKYKTGLENLTITELSRKIKDLNYQDMVITDPIQRKMLRAESEFLLDTLQDKKDIVGYNADIAGVKATVAKESEEEQISMAESEAGILENDLKYSNQSLENRLQALRLQNKTRRLANEQQGYQNEVLEETLPALKKAPGLQNETRRLGNKYQGYQNYIAENTEEYQVAEAEIEAELARIQRDQAQRKHDYTKEVSDEELYGTTGDIEDWAIGKEDWVTTPEGMPQLGENDNGLIVYAKSGKSLVKDGKIVIKGKDMYGRDIYTIKPADYFVPGSAEKGYDKDDGEKGGEKGGDDNTQLKQLLSFFKDDANGDGTQQQPVNNGPGNWGDNPKYPLLDVSNRLKKDNEIKNNTQLISILKDASPKTKKIILDLYGCSVEHLIYALSNSGRGLKW
jgi:hypothetical protein